MNCPSCNAVLADGADECVGCGIILSKWRQRQSRTAERPLPTAVRPATVPGTTIVPKRSGGVSVGKSTAVLASIGIIALLSVIVWFVARRGGKLVAEAQATLESTAPAGSMFDLAFKLRGSPHGIATNGAELIVGRRNAPGGGMRLTRKGGALASHDVQMLEDRYDQNISVATLTWNGTNYVGVTTATWFGQPEGDAFTIHDPVSLRVTSWKMAPPGLGGLAWDGKYYWASSRKNTEDANEPAKLYKFDGNFKEVAAFDPPGVGCQGLAFDGKVLWFVDVFSDEITILDVSATPPRVVKRGSTPLSYLSGIAYFDGAMWVTEYGSDSIQRLGEATRTAWLGIPRSGEKKGSQTSLASALGAQRAGSSSSSSIEELQRQLRSNERSTHSVAEMELDLMKAPVPYDWDDNSVDRGPEEAELVRWAAELRGGRVYAEWTIWFGSRLFQGGGETGGMVSLPKFVRYTVTVDFPGDAPDVEKTFEATPGEHRKVNVELAPAMQPGEYDVSLFIHVQYEMADGTARILNQSYPPLTLRQ